MVVTPAILEEWRRHQSKFARRWRLAMYAKKKIVLLPGGEDPELEDRILRTGRDHEQRQVMLKDIPLIHAALQSDGIVVSRDENARAFFQIRELSSITWVNPVSEAERVLEWLGEGAPAADAWKLGQH
jgi:hypothetical protein